MKVFDNFYVAVNLEIFYYSYEFIVLIIKDVETDTIHYFHCKLENTKLL